MVAMNRYFADFMAEYLAVPRERIHVIPPGLDLAGHPRRAAGRRAADRAGRHRTIGFLARVCPDKGLHLLAEALQLLAADPTCPPIRVHAAGYLAQADRPYLDRDPARSGRRGAGRSIPLCRRAGPPGEDRLPPVARRDERADRLPREQGALGARGLGQRRAGRAAGATGRFPK